MLVEGHLLGHPRGGVGQRLLGALAQLALPLGVLGPPVGAFRPAANRFSAGATCHVAAKGFPRSLIV